MKLKDLVLEKAILPALKGTKRDECIGELLDALVKAGAFKASLRSEFLKAVVKRASLARRATICSAASKAWWRHWVRTSPPAARAPTRGVFSL